MKIGNRFKNKVGNVYTRLRVIALYKIVNKCVYWSCFCDPKLGGCGKIIPVRSGNLKSGHTKSCGCYRKCRVTSKETRKRMSDAKINTKVPISVRRKISKSKKGVKLSAEHKRKISKSKKGENHPNWNTNLTTEDRIDRRHIPGYKEWRELVYRLDDYTCRKCGKSPSGNLNAHHIESYRANPTLRTEVSNGITFCEDCHLDFHHQYGYGDNTRAQLKEFLYYG